MGRIVIAAYRPRPGKQSQLAKIVRNHLPVLRTEGLVTDRAPVVMRAKDGTIVEVFEWKSSRAIERAHSNPAVQALWKEFDAVSTYVKVSTLAESQDLFAEFEPVDL